MKIFSGTANENLTFKIRQHLNLPHGDIYHKTFASGELYCQFKENIRGEDVFFINPISYPANDNLMQLNIMADAARRASAGRITAVIPYFGYARQDRKDKSRVPISAKLVMDILEASGFNRVVTMDLHAAQVGGFTNLPFDHLSFKPSLLSALTDNNVKVDVVVAPDIGAVKRAREYSKVLNTPIAIVVKERLSDTEVEVENFIGDVKGKRVLMIDDLTESLGTLTQASTTCWQNGAKEVIVAVTHGCFSEKGIDNLRSAVEKNIFTKFLYSNTIGPRNTFSTTQLNVLSLPQVINVDVSTVFATAINRIHKNESVSELFDV